MFTEGDSFKNNRFYNGTRYKTTLQSLQGRESVMELAGLRFSPSHDISMPDFEDIENRKFTATLSYIENSLMEYGERSWLIEVWLQNTTKKEAV